MEGFVTWLNDRLTTGAPVTDEGYFTTLDEEVADTDFAVTHNGVEYLAIVRGHYIGVYPVETTIDPQGEFSGDVAALGD